MARRDTRERRKRRNRRARHEAVAAMRAERRAARPKGKARGRAHVPAKAKAETARAAHKRQRFVEGLARQRAKLAPVIKKVTVDTPEKKGLHAVAALEAIKGVGALLGAVGLLALRGHDVAKVAARAVTWLHLDPNSHYPAMLLEEASKVTDKSLVTLTLVAVAYAVVRLVEAYGLWHGRAWAEWFAIVSGSLYLPFEIWELFKGVSVLKAAVLLVNVVIVAYLIRERRSAAKAVSAA